MHQRAENLRLIRKGNLLRITNRQKKGDERGAPTPRVDAGAATMPAEKSAGVATTLSAVEPDDIYNRDDGGNDETGKILNDAQ